jgi:hypothetical protein
LRQQGINLTKHALGGIGSNISVYDGMYGANDIEDNPWKMKVGDGIEDLTKWL